MVTRLCRCVDECMVIVVCVWVYSYGGMDMRVWLWWYDYGDMVVTLWRH